jgi:23S rRNA (adenine2030-N6)-methyltransferase
MNYRHAFHAGNFADVLKHAILVWIVRYLQQKPAAIRIVDTHAGIGRYDLGSDEARRTGEWLTGIGRLAGPDAPAVDPALADFLTPYLDLVRGLNDPVRPLRWYPGSPDLTRLLLRPDDRLQANEAHPEDLVLLRRHFHRDGQVTVMGDDAYTALKAALPPKERRGLVLIDPPFEVADEFARLERGLAAALTRFATGVYMIWYPVKDPRTVAAWASRIAGLGAKATLRVELDVGSSIDLDARPGRLARSGLLILNPPFGLEDALQRALPHLAAALAVGPGARGVITTVSAT